jgi:hypothetical protein
MREGLRLWGRGFSIVFFTAMNVSFIAKGRYVLAFLTALAISWLWWHNTRRSVHGVHVQGSAIWYGLGAACGTVTGMWLSSLR